MSDSIFIKSRNEIELMRQAGRIAAAARSAAGKALKPGITTKELDRIVHDCIVKAGAYPTFYKYAGYPGHVCISVNDEVIHGIPGKRVIHDGDIVSVDVGATWKGMVGDCAATFLVGEVDPKTKELVEVTRQSFFEGLKYAKPGYRISDIGAAVQEYAESHGFSVVRDYVGHGVGHKLHEAPEVPNYRPEKRVRGQIDPRLVPGMTIAVEPMINMGTHEIIVLDDEWTVITADGMPSAHYENTILITDGEPEILTMAEDI